MDNSAAKAGMIKGASASADSAAIILELHLAVLRLSCDPWVGFVYSEDNISDLPSRGQRELLLKMEAIERPMVLPSLPGCFLGAFH